MLKEAIDRILDLARPDTIDAHGILYATLKDKHPSPLYPPVPAALNFKTLTGLKDYILSELDDGLVPPSTGKLALTVVGETRVDLITSMSLDGYYQRWMYATAVIEAAAFPFGTFLSQEDFVIKLQSQFVPGDDLAGLLRTAGSITGESVQVSADDGVSQSASARRGIVLKERIDLPNPVTLRPYRTFREVDQPASKFVLRVKEGSGGAGLALFEADGGVWKLEAVQGIKMWLKERLPEMLILA